jgi:hypothetical protein
MKLCVGAIVLGFVLIAASAISTTLFSPESSWTEEKAQRWNEVKSRLYDLGFLLNSKSTARSAQNVPALRAEVEALEKENQLLAAEFHSVTSRPHTMAKIFKWSGISLAVVGLIGMYAVKQSS